MLESPQPPEGSIMELARELSRQVANSSFGRQVGRYVQPDQLTATAAHPVFVLSLRDVADGFVLPPGDEHAWRYLLEVDQEVVAAAEINQQGGGHSFGYVNVGPFVDGTVAALEIAENGPTGAYNAAVIHIPALHTMLLWMRSTSGLEYDRIIPIAPSMLTEGQIYRVDELSLEISRIAQRAVAEAGTDPTMGGS